MTSMTGSKSRVRALVACGAAAALVLSACGGDDGGGGTAESWCDFVDEADVVDETLESFAANPASIEDGVDVVEGFIKRLPEEAPPEIADDAKTLADTTQQLMDALKDADYSIVDADLAFTQEGDFEARQDAANEGLDAYSETNCGRSFGDPSDSTSGDSGDSGEDSGDDSGDFDPAAGTIREQLVAQFESIGLTTDESECIADKLDFNDPAVQSGDIGAMLEVFEECNIGLDRLAQLGGG